MAKMVALNRIKDNPWRDKKRNPIDTAQVAVLAESMDTTQEFWEGVYGRDVDGYVELAFGHHRIDAARQLGLKEVPVTIRKFTDGEMLVWMIRENTKGEFLVVLEATCAAVRALGQGKVKFGTIKERTNNSVLRFAPSYIEGKEPSGTPGVPHPYTADTLAQFLGRQYMRPGSSKATNAVRAALGFLTVEEMQVEDFSVACLYNNYEQEEKRTFKPVKQILEIVTSIKKRAEIAKVGIKKYQAAMDKADAEQRKVQAEARARQAAEEKKEKELLERLAEAQREENAKKVKAIQAKLKAEQDAAEEKAVLDKIRISEIDAKIAATKAKEEAQKEVDDYVPHRKEADRIIHILERRDLSEVLKALARRPLHLKDRQRVWEAIMAQSDWLATWAAAQFNIDPSSKLRIKKEKHGKSK